MHILSHHQAGTVADTSQQIALDRVRDQLVEFAALGGHRLIAGRSADPHHRRQQRHHGDGIQADGRDLGVQQPQAMLLVARTVYPTTFFDKTTHGMQARVGMERRPDQFRQDDAGVGDEVRRRRRQAALADPGLAAEHHPRRGQRARQRARPTVLEVLQFAVATHQRTTGDLRLLGPLAHHEVVGDQLVDPLDCGSGQGLQLENVSQQRLDRIGDDDRPRRCKARDPRRQIGRQPVYVVLRGVQVHQPAMHPHSDSDLNSEAPLGLLAEPGHLAGDLQPGQNRPTHIVLMSVGVTEPRQQSVALRRADMALKAIHDGDDLIAVAADQQPVRLGFHPGGQHRGIHQIREQDRQSSDLTGVIRRGKQVLGIGVVAVDGQHLPGQRRRGSAITTVDGRHGAFEQFVDRSAGGGTGSRADHTVTHVIWCHLWCDIERRVGPRAARRRGQ